MTTNAFVADVNTLDHVKVNPTSVIAPKFMIAVFKSVQDAGAKNTVADENVVCPVQDVAAPVDALYDLRACSDLMLFLNSVISDKFIFVVPAVAGELDHVNAAFAEQTATLTAHVIFSVAQTLFTLHEHVLFE